MSSGVVIVDFGMGNLHSVKKSLDRMRRGSVVSSRPEDVARAEKIILPGVGHFGRAMRNLRELNLLGALHEAALVGRRPVLGICLGMELMTRRSEEGDAEGLGWLDAEVIKFNVSDRARYKIPHFGWNRVRVNKASPLMSGVPAASEFYFAHAYHLRAGDRSEVLSETEYDYYFPSAVEKENIFGVQYHPEKSHDAGARVLKNFIEL
ncbi:MAG TPA: imidazole glycerol phosphate synthase subunit HisH [Pyrinomonadaceae bacterium]